MSNPIVGQRSAVVKPFLRSVDPEFTERVTLLRALARSITGWIGSAEDAGDQELLRELLHFKQTVVRLLLGVARGN